MKKYTFISVIFMIFTILNIRNSFCSNDDICKISIDSKDSINKNETLEVLLNISNIDTHEGISAINGMIEYDNEVFEDVKYEKTSEWKNFYELNNVLFFVTEHMEENFRDSTLLKIKLKVKENAKTGETLIKFSKIEVVGESNSLRNIDDVEKKININDIINSSNDQDNIYNNDKVNGQNNNQNTYDKGQESKDEIKNFQNEMINNDNQKGESDNFKTTNAKADKIEQNASIADKILSKTGLGITSFILIIILISLGLFYYIKYKRINKNN